MAISDRPPKNAFVASARKIYNPVGFSKGYNFILWFILVGALFGFCLARVQYLDFYNRFCPTDGKSGGAAPGECFYFLGQKRYGVGMILHLAGILPAGLLACIQFVPVVRHKFILLHRVNGYVVILLSLIATVGAYMIANVTFGGGVDIQLGVGFLGIAFIGSLTMAYINVKRLQIEQHRAWMLRGWVYAGSIITLRIIQILMMTIVPKTGEYYHSMPCDKVAYMFGDQNTTVSTYPVCEDFFSGVNPHQSVAIRADLAGATSAAEASAALNQTFGPAMWLSLIIHIIGVEIYLHLTPAEAERLRNVSYQRQIEAGMREPGRAGLTVDRFGDAEVWVPKNEQ